MIGNSKVFFKRRLVNFMTVGRHHVYRRYYWPGASLGRVVIGPYTRTLCLPKFCHPKKDVLSSAYRICTFVFAISKYFDKYNNFGIVTLIILYLIVVKYFLYRSTKQLLLKRFSFLFLRCYFSFFLLHREVSYSIIRRHLRRPDLILLTLHLFCDKKAFFGLYLCHYYF